MHPTSIEKRLKKLALMIDGVINFTLFLVFFWFARVIQTELLILNFISMLVLALIAMYASFRIDKFIYMTLNLPK